MFYLDSSAIVKLVVPERETRGLTALLRTDPERVSSVLARIEVLRAVGRSGAGPPVLDRARSVLRSIAMVRLEDRLVEMASRIMPPDLRTLDAVHLATALSLASSLSAIVCYDGRLSSAAEALGLTVVAPS